MHGRWMDGWNMNGWRMDGRQIDGWRMVMDGWKDSGNKSMTTSVYLISLTYTLHNGEVEFMLHFTTIKKNREKQNKMIHTLCSSMPSDRRSEVI
jgi:hypothetical protein